MVRGMGIFRIIYKEGKERWLDVHENEWESARERDREVGGISRKAEINKEPMNQWGLA